MVERNRVMGRCGSAFTIDNLQRHGYAPQSVLDLLGVSHRVFRSDGGEALGQVSMMKAGLYFSSKLTTVSETCAKEIQTPKFGFGLNPISEFWPGDLIDETMWSPSTVLYCR